MIESVTTHITNRLKKFKVGNVILNVYGPGPARDIGETAMPCIAVSYHLPPQIDYDLAMPHQDVFSPSVTTVATSIPDDGQIYNDWITENNNGLDTITGPESWTWSKYPTPVQLHYQLDLLASNLTHMTAMQTLMVEAFPPAYEPTINGYAVRFEPYGDQSILDDLENPLFRTVYRYVVSNVWIDRLTERTAVGITDATLDFETTDEIDDN